MRVEMEVASACFARLKDRRRSMAGRTGCGLCGTESLEQVEPPLRPLAPCATPLSPPAIAAALRAMPSRQALQQRTGATHAAAWCSPDGDVRLVREDVGRHNALDKLVGAMVDGRRRPARRLLLHHQPRERRDGAQGGGRGHHRAGRRLRADVARRGHGAPGRPRAGRLRAP